MIDHLISLEAMLDIAILSGFSFGIDKAKAFAIEGELLGDVVSRKGRWPTKRSTQAIQDFAPIKTKEQLQQFMGCTNWVRTYLVQIYPALVKMLGQYLKPGAVFPEAGIGGGNIEDVQGHQTRGQLPYTFGGHRRGRRSRWKLSARDFSRLFRHRLGRCRVSNDLGFD